MGDGIFDNSNILLPQYTPGVQDMVAGSVKLTLVAFNENGSSRNSMVLTILPLPDATITIIPNDTLCAGKTATLSVDTIAISSFLWTPGGFTTASISVDTSTTGGIGSRIFTIRLQGRTGCENRDSTILVFRDCTSMEDPEDGFTGIVYPNPSNGKFTLDIQLTAPEKIDLTLINPMNETVFREEQIQVRKRWKRTFDFSDLPSGLYLLKCKGAEHVWSFKILIRK